MKVELTKQQAFRIALLIFAAHTVLFLIQIPQVYLYNANNQNPVAAWIPVAKLAWGVYLWAFITPLILWLGSRLPVTRRHLWRNLCLHLVFGFVLGAVQHAGYHTGLGAFGLFTAKVVKESLVNLSLMFNFISAAMVRYATIIAIQQAYLYFRESQERAFRLQQAELEMLKMQLHPHFFFNILNALSALIYRSPKDADRMITQLGDLFRIALRKDKAQEVSLAEELEFMKAFLQIHQTLMGNRLSVRWNLEPETLTALVPNLILQPIVENSIRHGIAPLEQGGQILVCASRQDGQLVLEVRDSGLGLASQKIQNGAGVGLANTRARLKNLYGAAHRFEIAALPREGTVVKIELPFREQAAGN
ncbi:MAG TPA: histidine kinase [Pyrinomonadaceae bacterium]|nr:histidine kinase [Pyrinomonadaceae bacterium]